MPPRLAPAVRRLLATAALLLPVLLGAASASASASARWCGRSCPAPPARTGASVRVTSTSATIVATVDARRNAGVTYRLQYRRRGTTVTRTSRPRVRGAGGGLVLHASLRGLRPATAYQLRVVGSGRSGTVATGWQSFSTRAPATTTTTGTSATTTPPPSPSPSPPTTATTTTTTTTTIPVTTAKVSPVTTTTAAVPPALSTPSPAARSMLWGAEIGSQLTGGAVPWDMSAATDFSNLVGKAPAILPFNIPWLECDGSCYWFQFPTQQMQSIRNYGSIPMLNWGSMSSPFYTNEPFFTLQNIIDGQMDSYLTAFAQGAKAWGHPFYLRFDWEMNGNWFPWGETANGNSSGQFVAAWRHVHDIFARVGATNVDWVWCPMVSTTNATSNFASLYPGSSYVDWTCLDGYNWGGLHGASGWQSFDQLFASTYAQITTQIAPDKPMMVGEVGSSEQGGSKASWISNMFSSLATGYPDIRALVWFDAFDGADDWPVETSSASLAAFAGGVANRQFASNGYAAANAAALSP